MVKLEKYGKATEIWQTHMNVVKFQKYGKLYIRITDLLNVKTKVMYQQSAIFLFCNRKARNNRDVEKYIF